MSGRRPRRAFAREPPSGPYYSWLAAAGCLAGFRFAPLVYLFAYLFLRPLTPGSLYLPPYQGTTAGGDRTRTETGASIARYQREVSVGAKGTRDNRYTRLTSHQTDLTIRLDRRYVRSEVLEIAISICIDIIIP